MLTIEKKEKYKKDGYVVVPGFLSEEETDILKAACKKIVTEMDPDEHKSEFSTKAQLVDDYFLSSGDKIRFFFEKNTVNKDGSLKGDRHASLNKIGHALHWLDPDFKRATFSTKVKELLKSMEIIDPVVIHSMYIFKFCTFGCKKFVGAGFDKVSHWTDLNRYSQVYNCRRSPRIGGEVIPHRDASYLYCEPPEKVVGLWIALEDAVADNGCLWFVPGSHTEELEYRSVRQTVGDSIQLTNVPPIQRCNESYVAEPVKKGDLILIHGMVIHKSELNTSVNPRPIYTFHVMDNFKSNFAKDNWIQPTENLPFPPIYTTDSN